MYTPMHALNMVSETRTRIAVYRSRHTVYLEKDFVTDSAFPFITGEELVARLDHDRIVIERMRSQRSQKTREHRGQKA